LLGKGAELIEATPLGMLEERWGLAVLVADLRLTEGDRPVLGEAISPRAAAISRRFG
jgi:hypothetical protein